MRQRIQKVLATAGIASRRRAESYLRAGRVTVNGAVATLGDSADPHQDLVELDGRRLSPAPHDYWLLHKPRGVLSTTGDPHARRTVLDLLPASARRGLFPVGRLDRDTEGLLLLTNDGAAAHALLHPSLGSEREYQVTARGRLAPRDLRRLARGVELDDGITAPARVEDADFDRRTDVTWFRLIVTEGRKRQIRRMLSTLQHPVVRLVRTRMGPLRLGNEPRGSARRLRPEEIDALERHVHERARAGAKRARRRPKGAADGSSRSLEVPRPS